MMRRPKNSKQILPIAQFIYMRTRPWIHQCPFSLTIDEVDTGHGFRPGNGFLGMNLATGTREITVSSHPLNCAKPSESINFDCEADSVLFIRELHDDTGAFSLSSVSSLDGTSALLKRKLILLKDKDVE